MELEQIKKLVKETMHNWKVDNVYLYFIDGYMQKM